MALFISEIITELTQIEWGETDFGFFESIESISSGSGLISAASI